MSTFDSNKKVLLLNTFARSHVLSSAGTGSTWPRGTVPGKAAPTSAPGSGRPPLFNIRVPATALQQPKSTSMLARSRTSRRGRPGCQYSKPSFAPRKSQLPCQETHVTTAHAPPPLSLTLLFLHLPIYISVRACPHKVHTAGALGEHTGRVQVDRSCTALPGIYIF